jgi:oligopeptide/dipeptide ABC transporter ATP-binding protein
MTYLLELSNVTKIFGAGPQATVALDDVSMRLEMDKPSIITVAGESGSGKTTLGMAVLGFLLPTSGSVSYKGADLTKMSGDQKFNYRKDVQAVFQDPFAAYNPFYTVDRILEIPIKQYKLATGKASQKTMIETVLQRVGLRPAEILGRFPHQLSGGQRQRLVVARALLLRPSLLVADEPVSMVDASLRASILESIRKLNQELGISVMYITHDLTTAYHISDGIIILYRGCVVEAGDEDSVIKNPMHPYTRLLIDSIPWPDIEMHWGKQPIIEPTEEASKKLFLAGNNCCKFAARCDRVMDICWKKRPPLYQVDPTRVAACYQYQGKPEVAGEDLGEFFTSVI